MEGLKDLPILNQGYFYFIERIKNKLLNLQFYIPSNLRNRFSNRFWPYMTEREACCELNLRNNHLKSIDFKQLKKILPNIKKINLNNNNVGELDLSIMPDDLKINLSNNQIKTIKPPNSLWGPPQNCNINLSNGSLSTQECADLNKLLQKESHLHKICRYGLCFGKTGLKATLLTLSQFASTYFINCLVEISRDDDFVEFKGWRAEAIDFANFSLSKPGLLLLGGTLLTYSIQSQPHPFSPSKIDISNQQPDDQN